MMNYFRNVTQRTPFTLNLSSCYRTSHVGDGTWKTFLQIRRNSCLLCQSSSIHTASPLYAAKAKNTRKKMVRPLRVNPKPMKGNIVSIQASMSVTQLAGAMDRSLDHVYSILEYVPGGHVYKQNDSVINNVKVIQEICRRSGLRSKIEKLSAEESLSTIEDKDIIKEPLPDVSLMTKRHPVVTIMGHVDHGKTTLLDALRNSDIVSQEHGGITQHIGAFSVKLASGEGITFLDTPGHAAFSAMRARGAKVTDIVVLVVAADDGVMNQTIESIEHAKNAGVPIIVAINKIDKPEADITRTKNMLLEQQLVVEDFGGDVQSVCISAVKGTNLLELQEAIVTQAEVMELKGDCKGLIEGHVVESRTDLGRGKLATAIIQRGTLKKGACLVAGTVWAKVRGMFDDSGRPIQEAPPSTPVEIIGWKDLPSAGDEILQVESEHRARAVTTWRLNQKTQLKVDEDNVAIDRRRAEHNEEYAAMRAKLRALGLKRHRLKKEKEVIVTNEGPQLSVVLKGDVDGSLEAILDTLDMYDSKKCRLDLIHYGIGSITDTDVDMANAFDGEVFGFNVQAPDIVKKSALSKNVPVKLHKVIYKLFDDMKDSLSARLPMLNEELIVGEANVLQVFQVTVGNKKVAVAGCRCVKGQLQKKKFFKLLRGEEIVYDGPISSLKHFKKEVENVRTDADCGISLEERDITFVVGDVFRCYDVTEVSQDIDWEPGS